MTTVGSDRIRIKLKAYDYRILDKAVAEIVAGIGEGCKQVAHSPAHQHSQVHDSALGPRGQEVP